MSDDAAFIADVRAFLHQNLVGDLLRLAQRQTGPFAEPALSRVWQRLLYDKGWAAPAWPTEYGGPGWTAEQRNLFQVECARAGAPILPAMGLQMCGPVLMRYGTDAQKARFLPGILTGDDYWCQGYSEPQAGSDLAAIALRAERDGSDYILNGTKLWTTHAQFADWMFILARTSNEGRPQKGITFLLASMSTPGMTVRPIISMSGDHEVNQVFFDDVRVPIANRVGDEGQGWEIAKYLLEFERGGGHQIPRLLSDVEALAAIARALPGEDGMPLWEDESLRLRIRSAEIDAVTAHWTEQRLVYGLSTGQNLGNATASLIKLAWSETAQTIGELLLETLGPAGSANGLAMADDAVPDSLRHLESGFIAAARYLNDRVTTIAGGSSEIQRNIIARELGL